MRNAARKQSLRACTVVFKEEGTVKKYVVGNGYLLYVQLYPDGNAQFFVAKNISNFPVGSTREISDGEYEKARKKAKFTITFKQPKSLLNFGKQLLEFLKEIYPDEFKND